MIKKTFLIVTLLVFFLSCNKDIVVKEHPRITFDEDSKNPLVVFLLDPKDSESIAYNNQLKKTVNYTKIPYQQLPIEKVNSSFSIPKTTKVLIIRDAEELSEQAIDSVINFVAVGNTLVITNASTANNAGFLYGTRKNATLAKDKNAKGIFFNNKIIPTFEGKGIDAISPHFGWAKENFKKSIDILAAAFNDSDYPLIVRNKIENGEVLFFNTTTFAQKENRGLLFAAILSGLENIPYTIANISTLHLDDFPAPLYKIKREPIFKEMQLYQDQFYKTVWWPDMLKIAKKYGLKYTAFPAFDYSGQTEPPFLFEEWNLNQRKENNQITQSDLLMKDVSDKNHELGFHGYNHVSLIATDWPEVRIMEASLQAVSKKWRAFAYGPLPQSYVPPTNTIDSIGISALSKGLPSLNIMSSLYLGDFESGGEREFDPEPYNQSFFDFPRISSGYEVSVKERFNDYSTFLYTGIWNHFLHPDDVFQIKEKSNLATRGDYKFRNEKNYGWRSSENGQQGMLAYFEDYLKQKKAIFPLLKSYKTIDAVAITKNWRKQNVDFLVSENLVKVTSNRNKNTPFYWFLYVKNENLTKVENSFYTQKVTFSKSPLLDGFLFQVRTELPEITIFKNKPLLSEEKKKVKEKVITKVKEYLAEVPDFKTIETEIDFYVANENLTKAITLQKSKIKSNNKFNEEDWLRLNQLFTWNNQANETWSFLNSQYENNPNKKYILFSEKLTELNYPTIETKQIWMKRQIESNPKNSRLKEEYTNNFGQEAFSKLSAEELILLITKATTKSEKIKYYNLLIADYPEKAIQLLKDKIPCSTETLKELAYNITWLFADREQFKKALAWSKCSSEIDVATIKNWRINTGEYLFLKEKYFDEYIAILLQKNPAKALQELENNLPCVDEKLAKHHADIAYAYGNIGRLRKALAWSECSDNFATRDQMQWAFQLENYAQVEVYFQEGLSKNKINDSEKLVLIEMYLQNLNYEQAFKYTNDLKESKEKEELKKRVNEIIFQISVSEQKSIIEKYPIVLYPENIKKIKRAIRIKKEKTIEFATNLLTDRLSPTSFGNLLTYNFRDKKEHKHSFGVSEYSAYALQLPFVNPNNTTQNFYGISYGIQLKERAEKLNFSGTTRFEFNSNGDLFYHVNLRANISKKNLYSSFQLLHQPAITSPAYNLNIYRTQLAIYEELNFKERYQAILSFEANHYSDNEQDVLLVGKFGYKINVKKRNIYIPFLETAGMLGTTDNSVGFPYWTIDQRFYGGLGMNYLYKNETTLVEFGLNAGAFVDTFSGSFLRYGGTIRYPVSNYFIISGNAEFFTIKNFYSNNFTLGLTYYLK